MKLIDKLILPVALALIVSVAGIVARVAVAANASAQPEGIDVPSHPEGSVPAEQIHHIAR